MAWLLVAFWGRTCIADASGGSCLSMWAEAGGGLTFADTIPYPAVKMLVLFS